MFLKKISYHVSTCYAHLSWVTYEHSWLRSLDLYRSVYSRCPPWPYCHDASHRSARPVLGAESHTSRRPTLWSRPQTCRSLRVIYIREVIPNQCRLELSSAYSVPLLLPCSILSNDQLYLCFFYFSHSLLSLHLTHLRTYINISHSDSGMTCATRLNVLTAERLATQRDSHTASHAIHSVDSTLNHSPSILLISDRVWVLRTIPHWLYMLLVVVLRIKLTSWCTPASAQLSIKHQVYFLSGWNQGSFAFCLKSLGFRLKNRLAFPRIHSIFYSSRLCLLVIIFTHGFFKLWFRRLPLRCRICKSEIQVWAIPGLHLLHNIPAQHHWDIWQL